MKRAGILACVLCVSTLVVADTVDTIFWGTVATIAVVAGAFDFTTREPSGAIIQQAKQACDAWEQATKSVSVDKNSMNSTKTLISNVEVFGYNTQTALQAPRKVTQLSSDLQNASRSMEDRFAYWKIWNRIGLHEDVDSLKQRLQSNLQLYFLLEQYFANHAQALRKLEQQGS